MVTLLNNKVAFLFSQELVLYYLYWSNTTERQLINRIHAIWLLLYMHKYEHKFEQNTAVITAHIIILYPQVWMEEPRMENTIISARVQLRLYISGVRGNSWDTWFNTAVLSSQTAALRQWFTLPKRTAGTDCSAQLLSEHKGRDSLFNTASLSS